MPLVASMNVLCKLSRKDAAAALSSILERAPDLVGLQEWGLRRRTLLHADPAYAWVAPPYGGNPVGFRRDRYVVLEVRLHPLAFFGLADRGVHPLRLLPPRTATMVRLRDATEGFELSVVNFHLVPAVQRQGQYRADRPLLVTRHRREVQRLSELVTRRQRSGDVVYAMGDSNFDGLQLPGLRSAWDGRRDDPVGTLGSRRKIDDVFSARPTTSVTLVRTASDHAAVLAVSSD